MGAGAARRRRHRRRHCRRLCDKPRERSGIRARARRLRDRPLRGPGASRQGFGNLARTAEAQAHRRDRNERVPSLRFKQGRVVRCAGGTWRESGRGRPGPCRQTRRRAAAGRHRHHHLHVGLDRQTERRDDFVCEYRRRRARLCRAAETRCELDDALLPAALPRRRADVDDIRAAAIRHDGQFRRVAAHRARRFARSRAEPVPWRAAHLGEDAFGNPHQDAGKRPTEQNACRARLRGLRAFRSDRPARTPREAHIRAVVLACFPPAAKFHRLAPHAHLRDWGGADPTEGVHVLPHDGPAADRGLRANGILGRCNRPACRGL